MPDSPRGRREFLLGSAAGAVRLAAGGAAEAPAVVTAAAYGTPRPGADFMVDVPKPLDFEYVCVNSGSSFHGFYGSLVKRAGQCRFLGARWCGCTRVRTSIRRRSPSCR